MRADAMVFGLAADPKGGYGIGVIQAADVAEMEALCDADPAMQSGIGFSYDILPTVRIVMAGGPKAAGPKPAG